MARNNDVGITQLKNKNWQYRIKIVLPNGEKYDSTCRLDEHGQPFRTKTAAKDARIKKLAELKTEAQNKVKKSWTLGQAWEYYLKNDALGKRPSTRTKHASVWENHIKQEFADRDVNAVTVAEIDNFLLRKYTTPDTNGKLLSYGYIEAFIKLFYLLFGISNRCEKIDDDRYNRMFLNKGTKIRMPIMRQDEKTRRETVTIYEQYEIAQIESVLKDTDGYIPFLLGFYCGLRISETFGLMWKDVNWNTKELTINKQMQVIDGIYYLLPVKTQAGVRTIKVPDVVISELSSLLRKQCRRPSVLFIDNKTEKVHDQTRDKEVVIVGGDFINRRTSGPFEGQLMTPNSMKMYAKEIRTRVGIDFKYHTLRKTHITQLINAGVPDKEVSKRVGHTKVSTTHKSYVGSDDTTKQLLLNGLNQLNTEEPMVEVKLPMALQRPSNSLKMPSGEPSLLQFLVPEMSVHASVYASYTAKTRCVATGFYFHS